MGMGISIIMASTLQPYCNAATQRDKKIVRAYESLLKQAYKEWELIVVSDGCKDTIELMKDRADKCILIDKQPIWSGVPRNTGIDAAKYDTIVYLDNDDVFDTWHLEHIANNEFNDALLFGDLVPVERSIKYKEKLNTEDFRVRGVQRKRGFCGTSNIAHRKGYYWNDKSDYAHDWHFIKQFKELQQIKYGGYMVCHIPKLYDI